MAELHESGGGLRRRKGGNTEGTAEKGPALEQEGPAAVAASEAEEEDDGDIGSEADEGVSTAQARAEEVGRAGPGPGPPPAEPEGPISASLTSELMRRLIADFPSCCAGQFMSAACSQRHFLTCLGAHRSMAVFAWAPGKDPQGFAAHLTSGAIRFSLEQRSEFLPEVVRAITKTFLRLRKADVVIHIVGDIIGEPLRRYFSDMPVVAHCCSLHLEAALHRAGFMNVDKELCAAFEEEEDAASLEPPEGGELPPRPSACATGDGRRFSMAALDLAGGQVIVQSVGTIADVKIATGKDWPAVEAEYERDKGVHRERFSYAPMTQANGSAADFWTAYHELAAHPLPVVCLVILLIAAIVFLGPLVGSVLPGRLPPFVREQSAR